jgi:hypothetical protein
LAIFQIFEIAHITAIYKKSGPKTCKTSFRPISILPTLSKIFESVVHDRLLKHCTENSIITDKQAAYLKGDSTVSQLLYIVHNIKQNWTNKKISLFLDVSAAFEQLTDICRTLRIDVLILSESKLDQTIPNNLITIPGYHEPLRHDRPINGRHGGGVLMYIAENLVYQH